MISDTGIVSYSFFTGDLSVKDPAIYQAILQEESRQGEQIELIAPKNYLSPAVRQSVNSLFSLTSVEGYPGKRFHAGVSNLDTVENIAIERAKKLFRCCYANVQPHSGTQANQAVFFALLDPGDTVLSMALSAGGHLSHGLRSNLSGKWFNVQHYGVRDYGGLIDYDEVDALCRKYRPKLIICGGSSYPRNIDFSMLRKSADGVGAYLLADIAHFSGLVAAGIYPNPFPHVHVVTTTTNKNLRGPRGGLILCDGETLGKKLNSAVFPGIQGGPLPEMIIAKAVSFGEALKEEFNDYARAVFENARTFSRVLQKRGYDIVTNGTDSPLVMVDLRSKGLTGDHCSDSLEAAHLPCNKNLVPGDIQKPSVTSGLRFGLSAVTTRGLRAPQCEIVANLVADVLHPLTVHRGDNREAERDARERVKQLCRQFPLYPSM